MPTAPSGWRTTRAEGLWICHGAAIDAEEVVRAIERHRHNAERRHAACEHWAPASSVSRVRIERPAGALDLAVKWSHWRGFRRGLADALRGSRSARALAGAQRLRGRGVACAEPLALAERRRFGLVRESFLLARFVADAAPLPVALPELRATPLRRRAVARALGDLVGRLHAGGLDHTDLKHSNLLLTRDDRVVLLDLDALARPRRLGWRRVVRALGQLEAYAVDLYPWLPRSDRARFLRAYLARVPGLAPRRRELVRDARAWARARLSEWARRDRSESLRYPLAPRVPAAPGPTAPVRPSSPVEPRPRQAGS
jgi:hypothetical protein